MTEKKMTLQEWEEMKLAGNRQSYEGSMSDDLKASVDIINKQFGQPVFKILHVRDYTQARNGCKTTNVLIEDLNRGVQFQMTMFDNPFDSSLEVEGSYSDYDNDEGWESICVSYVPDHIFEHVDMKWSNAISATEMLIEIASGQIYGRYLDE